MARLDGLELRGIGGRIDIGAATNGRLATVFLGAEWQLAEKLKVFGDVEASSPLGGGKTSLRALGGIRLTW